MKNQNRERELLFLVEAINDYFGCDAAYYDVDPFELADHLLSKGVIVLPFPVGTIYYRVVKTFGKHVGSFFAIRKASLNYYNMDKVIADFGKTVFLTREEAENALKERSEE